MPQTKIDKLIAVLNTYSGRDKALRTLYFTMVLISSRLARRRIKLAKRLLSLARQLSRARLVARQLNFPQMLQAIAKIPKQLRDAYKHAIFEFRRDSLQDSEMRLFLELHNSKEPSSLKISDACDEKTDKAKTSELLMQRIAPASSLCPAALASTIAPMPDSPEFYSPVYVKFIDVLWRLIFTQRGNAIASYLIDEVLASTVTFLYTLNTFVEFIAWLAESRIIFASASRWFLYSLYCWIGALTTAIIRFSIRAQRIGWSVKESAADRLNLVSTMSDLITALNMLPTVRLLTNGRKLSFTQSAVFSLVASIIGFYKSF